MTEKNCLNVLLNPIYSLDKKAEAFGAYLHSYETIAKRMRCGASAGHRTAMHQLRAAASSSRGDSEVRKLEAVLDQIRDFSRSKNESLSKRAKDKIRELRGVAPGTPIRILDDKHEITAIFLEAKRTRFVVEYADGQQFSVPGNNFIDVAHDAGIERLPVAVRRQRELLRSLADSRHHGVVTHQLVSEGIGVVHIALDELAAAFDRIKNAPVRLSRGAFSACLGPRRIVNPRDHALTKFIPSFLSELANHLGGDLVRQRIEEYANEPVRTRAMRAVCS